MQRTDILEQLKNYVALHLLDGDATDLSATTPLLEWGIINSLAITRLLNFIQSQFHVTILLDQVVAEQFETLDALTDLILTAPPSKEHSVLTEQDATPTLSPGQQRLWFLQQLEPTLTAYNEYVALRLLGTLDVPALEASLSECVRRQESLRTGFPVLEDQATPTIAAWHPLEIARVDLSEFPLLIREAQAIRLAEAQIRQPFQLEDAPLLRVSLFHIEHNDHLLLVVMHHIVTDGWSTGILLQELSSLYATYHHKTPASLPALQARYTDFSRWQQRHLQGEKLTELQRYWETQLADTSLVLDLPTDHPRPNAQTYRGAHIPFQLSPEITQALRLLSQREGVTQFMTLLAAFQLLLYRYSGQRDFVLGTPVANRSQAEFAPVIGFFVNMLVLRARVEEHMTFHDLLQQAREVVTGAMLHQEFPFEELVNLLRPERDLSRSPLFQVMFNVQERSWLETEFDELEVMAQDLERGSSKYDISLMLVEGKDTWYGYIEYCTDLFTTETIERLIEHFRTLLGSVVSAPEQLLTLVPLLTQTEHQLLLEEWNKTASEYPTHTCIHQLIEEQVTRSPQKEALLFEHQQLTYEELNRRANQLAHYLRRLGIGPDVAVGLCMERSLEMVIGILGILKAGGVYVPLDPGYPRERLDFMLADAQIHLLITQRHLLENFAQADEKAWLCLDSDWPLISQEAQTNPPCTISSDSLAYIMYTSGSTGSPHGVMVTHRNVVNFFTAMEQQLGEDEVGTWLAVTSISFDISILELLWPLTRGFKVIVLAHQDGLPLLKGPARPGKMDFSLFYFANNDETTAVDDKYRLLLEGAQFADQHGFVAVWTPERHFHPFGGLYPNPAVTGAAVATITRQVEIRAGSVVLPLHHPVRVAEEWSVVDNLSRGRASISFATGWQANDFVLMPENYVRRKEIMVRDIETVRQLWRGEMLTLENGLGKPTPTRIFPQPFQQELPIWITTGGSMETFKLAGELGANLLTHLLGQSIEELAEKIRVYRDAREKAGYAPAEGRVALMLHTFIGMDQDAALEKVRQPFLTYLKSSFSLMRDLTRNLGQDIETLSEDDIDALLTHAFNRFYQTSSLIGTPETCLKLIERLKEINVDEIACLIDFGVDTESVLESLHCLNQVRERSNQDTEMSSPNSTLLDLLTRHRITHMQCTPSLATLLVQEPEILSALRPLRKLLLGGEALSASLAAQLSRALKAQILNMYGPTETTIWSTTYVPNASDQTIPIGRPLANTQVYILNQHLQPQPINVAGELLIGGAGVARGYFHQPELTSERFITHPFSHENGARVYKTGDRARYRADGVIEFLGRTDQQVKLHGARVELGEIEHMLDQYPAIAQSGVILQEEEQGVPLLVAYLVVRQQQTLSLDDLRKFLSRRLPHYMLPSAFVELPALPLTPNGKIDHRALLARAHPLPREHLTEPRTPLEEKLVHVWSEVLGQRQVGIYDSFFALGGHSLLATQLISRINALLGLTIPLRHLFEAPSVAGFIDHLLETEVELAHNDMLEQALTEVEQLSLARQAIGEKA